MRSTRVEAFSDGVIAILITIMVLELKVPHETGIAAIASLAPVLLSYVLSFIYLGIYWNNHHHMFQATEEVNGKVLWANLHLLFWLSLVPFVTAWMGENNFATTPTAVYGFVLLLVAVAYELLQKTIIAHGRAENKVLADAVGSDLKGKASLALYVAAIPLAFVNRWIAYAIYVFVALIWFIPDPRIEKKIEKENRT